MPKAGYCSACRGQVWLTDEGSCRNGHDSRCISGVYEAPVPEPPAGGRMSGSASGEAAPTKGAGTKGSGRRAAKPRKKGRTIRGATFSVLLIGAAVLAYAIVVNKQPVTKVDLKGGIIELGTTKEAVQDQQVDIQGRLSKLEQQAEQKSKESPAAKTADVAGRWAGSTGFYYDIAQYGNRLVIQELMQQPDGLYVTATGAGTIEGNRIVLDNQAVNQTASKIELTIMDERTLAGSIRFLPAGGSAPMTLRR